MSTCTGPVKRSATDSWVYGDFTPDPDSRDLVGLKARWIVERLPKHQRPLVLDFGAGEGKHLQLVRKVLPDARLVGVDIRDVHGTRDFEFCRVAPDAALPFAPDRFDVVISCDVLEHVDDIERSLEEIRRVLRPGGAFIGFVPLEGGPGPHAFFRLIDPNIYRDTKDHQHAYRRGEMRRLLSSRFRIIKLSYSYHFLGSLLDAVFFASFRFPGFGSRMEEFWRGQENVFYRGGGAQESRPSLMVRVSRLANRAAYWESRVLSDFPFGCIGLHFHLEK
jgi:SAM-dependent methyltransferase